MRIPRRTPDKASKKWVMQRFKTGDAVFILPKFAHLYPGNSAVVIGVKADPFRPMFNEYTLEFADRSAAKLLEFQIIKDVPNYDTLIAVLAFDSQHHVATAETRGGYASGRQIIFQTSGFDLDIRIRLSKSHASVMGQVLERTTKDLLKNLEVGLMKEGMPISTAVSDSVGVFSFSDVPHGSLNILAVVPQRFSRILGAFSI
jgi:hypothetical protein